ncbi:MAG: CIA30 family protein, partial [Bacteroidetes bacterium]|nr:CIA30 family protein [Bacteroidota bacterium]
AFTSKDAGLDDLLDSDVDISTGKTPCFNIDPSWCDSNSTKWDAGIISCPPGVKVAGKVFNDANGNGIHDAGEVGIANVEIKLWGIAANLIASTLSDAQGKFEFLNVIDGQYHVQEIDLPGYISTTPNSEFITIAGSDKSGIKFGDKVKPTPEPCDLTKYSTMTQDSWKSVKGYNLLDSKFTTLFPLPNGLIIGSNGSGYQIKFTSSNAVKNFLPQSGVPYALDQSYINPVSTPAGQFAGHILALALNIVYNDAGLLGHSSTTKLGNLVVGSGPLKDFKVYEVLNIVNKALGGTVSPFDMGTLNNVVKKINENFDNCNLGFLICPPVPDSCGGGFDAGVESNSNLADFLLRRLTKIEYGQTTKMLRNPKIAFTASYGLNELFPRVGPLGSSPKETTPFDILGISNATSAFAVDYNINMAKGDVRVASIFATTTNPPYVYEHTKSICDRLIDAELQHLSHIEINGKYYFASLLYKQAEDVTDYTVNFTVYEKGGTFIVDSRWLIEDYDVPSGVSNVYNFQVWASNFNSTMYLVMSIIDQFASRGTVQYKNDISLPPTLVYVQKGKYSHTGNVELVIRNNQEVADNIIILSKSRAVQGSGKIENSQSFSVQPGLNTIYLKTGVISDANLYISSSNGFRDEVFVSGGAYTYLNGSATKVEEFVTNTFSTVAAADLPNESLILSGGAKVKGKLSDWVSMFRSLTANTAPYDLSDYNALKVTMRGYGKVWLRLEQDGIRDFNFHAKQIVLDGSEQNLTIPFSEFKQVGSSTAKFDPSLVRKISIYMDKKENSSLTNFEFEIKNIVFLSKNGSDKSKGESVPKEFKLQQNYPNPFNPSTLIEFSVAKSELVTIKVYNVLGKEVANLVNGIKEPGVHSVRFDANGLSSGVYLYKIQSESYTATKKMILQK